MNMVLRVNFAYKTITKMLCVEKWVVAEVGVVKMQHGAEKANNRKGVD